MDFYLTINSRRVRKKAWYTDIKHLPQELQENLTGKNEWIKRHQNAQNSGTARLKKLTKASNELTYATSRIVVFCGLYPVSCLLLEKRKQFDKRFGISPPLCSYQVDDTLNFPADANFVHFGLFFNESRG